MFLLSNDQLMLSLPLGKLLILDFFDIIQDKFLIGVARAFFHHHIAYLFAEVLETHHLGWHLIVFFDVVSAWDVLQFRFIDYLLLLLEDLWVLFGLYLYVA